MATIYQHKALSYLLNNPKADTSVQPNIYKTLSIAIWRLEKLVATLLVYPLRLHLLLQLLFRLLHLHLSTLLSKLPQLLFNSSLSLLGSLLPCHQYVTLLLNRHPFVQFPPQLYLQ
jgi:hypothetical protein